MKILVFVLFLSGSLLAGEPSNDNVTVGELARAMKKLHAQAEAGDASSCYELWKAGRIIEKVDILRELYPVEVRFKLLKFAAEKGSVEANFELFEYLSCVKKKPFSETRKWLEFAHRNGNNKASVILALVLGIDKNKPDEAFEVINMAKERIPQDVGGKDEFAAKRLSNDDFELLRTVIQEGNIASFNKEIGVAEGELKESVEIWRMSNRSSDIACNSVTGERIVSPQGSKSGMDSNTDVHFSIVAILVENPPALRLEIKNTKGLEAVLVEWFPVGGVECDVVKDGVDPQDVRVDALELGRARFGPASYALLPPQREVVSTVNGVFVVSIPLDSNIDPKLLIGGRVKVRLRFLSLENIPNSSSGSSRAFLEAFDRWESSWIAVNSRETKARKANHGD